jgi:hypothetical protein
MNGLAREWIFILCDFHLRIENKMKLVGATGIEDRLQVSLPRDV